MDTREIVQDERSAPNGHAVRQICLRCSKRAVANLAGGHLIDIAPHPCFAGLNRPDERMLGLMEVLGGVRVLR